ncbi:MAG: hypothetical protein U0T69_04615 [Chitinophagales bacterium]
MLLSFFITEDGMPFFGNNLNIIHLHFIFAVLFLISYSIKSLLFLFGNKETFLIYKKKTLLVETLFSVGFLVFGFWMFIFHIRSGNYANMHWLDPKITLALLAIPVGIIGFKKENKIMVTTSLAFFIVALVIGLMHYQ